MPRRGFIAKRDVLPDPLYNSKIVTRLINNIMLDGKKGVAQKVVYGAFDIIKEKTEKAQQKLAKKDKNLQTEMQQLAEKYQKGLITTRDAQAKEQELQKRAASFQTSAQKEGKELEEESIVFQNRMNDLLMRAIHEINDNKQYKMIVQSTALLDADESLDLTEKVLAKVNELYAAEKPENKKK